MKIIFAVKAIYPFHSYGGVEKYIFNIAKHLVSRGINVEIAAPAHKNGSRKEWYAGIEFTFFRPEISAFSDSSAGRVFEHIFGLQLYRYLLDKDFDLLHGIELTPYAYLHKKNRKKVISHLFYDTYRKKPYRDVTYYIKYPFIVMLKNNAVKYCVKNSDCILTETPAQTRELLDIFKPVNNNKIMDVPVAVDIKGINDAVSKNTKVSRESLGIKRNDFVIISVNRIVPEKGIEYLAGAFHLLQGRIPNVRLILAGTGYQEDYIIQKLSEYGVLKYVIHLKNISEKDLYSYYSISDVYVSPTLQEDFIMSIQEAMVCGLPIVSTGQDWLVKEGINGYLAAKRSPEQLADKIYRIFSEKTGPDMGEKSKEIIKPYDYDTVTDKLTGIYEKTIAGKL